ncbi:MAG: hypothetical protein HC769_00780 [Cyanobacteria bacterium CRU_2_1]|nr:hypothetical protein [Cyanobacteria bacterium CRU_2_1]
MAYGAPKYVEMAKALGRSLALHSPDIPRAIVTDRQDDKELAALFDQFIPFKPEYGSNLRQKIHLDQYSPYQRTLFIDSDCIVVRDLHFVFERFEGRNFGVVGGKYHLKPGDKDPYFNVDYILQHFKLEKLPKFNGGIYYFDDSDVARSVFNTAQEISQDFEQLGFSEFRGDGPNEEPILATAMELHQQTMLQDHGEIMRTPVGLRGPLDIDVLEGRCAFKKGTQVVSPAIIHFAYIWNDHPIYYREVQKLKQWANNEEVRQVRVSLYSMLKYQFNVAKYASKRLSHRSKALLKRVSSIL